MKILFTLVSAVLFSMSANAQTDTYSATTDGTLNAEYSSPVMTGDNMATVTVEKSGVTLTAVGGTTPANSTSGLGQQIDADGNVAAWNAISWSAKTQADISFSYINGTGVPYLAISSTENEKDGVKYYTAAYTYYSPDGGKLPISGLYYKFAPKYDGTLKVGVWINKGKRNTYVVDGETTLPLSYTAEGYINGQNDANGLKKYLTNDEIKALHDAAFVDATTGVDALPYVVGAGGQPFFGYLTVEVKANKTYWFFQESSQLGFEGFEFKYGEASAISSVEAAESNANAPVYNLAGQKVGTDYKGIVIQNGKKFVQK